MSITANAIGDLAPAKDSQGRVIEVNYPVLAERIDKILKTSFYPGHILVEAWRAYLEEQPKWLKAPHYFFGELAHQKGGAHFEAYAKFAMHQENKAKLEAQHDSE